MWKPWTIYSRRLMQCCPTISSFYTKPVLEEVFFFFSYFHSVSFIINLLEIPSTCCNLATGKVKCYDHWLGTFSLDSSSFRQSKQLCLYVNSTYFQWNQQFVCVGNVTLCYINPLAVHHTVQWYSSETPGTIPSWNTQVQVPNFCETVSSWTQFSGIWWYQNI